MWCECCISAQPEFWIRICSCPPSPQGENSVTRISDLSKWHPRTYYLFSIQIWVGCILSAAAPSKLNSSLYVFYRQVNSQHIKPKSQTDIPFFGPPFFFINTLSHSISSSFPSPCISSLHPIPHPYILRTPTVPSFIYPILYMHK